MLRARHSVFTVTISLNDTQLTIYSSKRLGNTLSRVIRISERELQPQQFEQLWRPKRNLVWAWKQKRREASGHFRWWNAVASCLFYCCSAFCRSLIGGAKAVTITKRCNVSWKNYNLIIASWKAAAFICFLQVWTRYRA